jgi:mannan endo-1,4-beta-mannosidase
MLLSMIVLAATVVRADVGAPEASEFVRVASGELTLRGAPFRFLGANVGVMHSRAHRDGLDAVLDAVVEDGMNVIRVWALGERAEGSPEWATDYAFRIGEEGWVETSFTHLDRVLVAARARELKVIVVLANRWRDFGGFPQYMRWAGVPFDENAAYPLSELELVRFWDCARCDELYRTHVEHVVTRVNSISGLAYRDDPTILSWELVNESSAPARARALLVSWTQRMAHFVRALDSKHLIAAGHIGYERAHQRQTWREVSALPEIDYCDAHAYPASYGRVDDIRELRAFVHDRVALARELGKPLIWGEFGFRTRALRVMGVPRARWYDAFLTASRLEGVTGALVWNYLPWSGQRLEHAIHPRGEGDAWTLDIRATLRRAARRWTRRGSAPERPAAERALYPRYRVVHGRLFEHDQWENGVLRISVFEFERARFEALGRVVDGPVRHVWGEGTGDVRYAFRAPRGGSPSSLAIRFRASSELPGRGAGASSEDGARIEVLLDGERMGVVDVAPDDGVGRDVELVVEDPGLLTRLFAHSASRHRLELRVVPDVGAEGLCLYERATDLGTLTPEQRVGLPASLELQWTRDEPAP